MHEKVRQFFKEAQQKIYQQAIEERNQNLINWGLFEEVECDRQDPGAYYDGADSKTGEAIYRKKVIFDVSDEEYRRLLSVIPKVEDSDNESTMSEDTVQIAATIMLIASIVGSVILLIIGIGSYAPILHILGAILTFIVGLLFYCVVMVWLKQARNIMKIKQAVHKILADRD